MNKFISVHCYLLSLATRLPRVDFLTRAFSTILAETTNYQILSKRLALLGADGKVRMRLEATSLK